MAIFWLKIRLVIKIPCYHALNYLITLNYHLASLMPYLSLLNFNSMLVRLIYENSNLKL